MVFAVTNDFSSGINTNFSTELNENNTDIENEINGVTPTPDTFQHVAPIGSVVAWFKNITGVPSLHTNWVECNGQTLSDANSLLNGQVIPDLNGTNNFLRGNSTSDTLEDSGGASTHTHGITVTGRSSSYGGGSGGLAGISAVGGYTPTSNPSTGTGYTGTGSSLPPYTNVVWIMRIK